MRILAIDPGTTKSGWCLLEDGAPTDWGWDDNEWVKGMFKWIGVEPTNDVLVIEDVGHYGLPVGRDVFETVKWIGRFIERYTGPVALIPRPEVLVNLCGKRQGANDSSVRQALIDRFGGDEVAVGGKKCQTCKGKGWKGAGRPVCPECDGDKYETPPGVLYGISGHAWSALAVGVTYLDLDPAKTRFASIVQR